MKPFWKFLGFFCLGLLIAAGLLIALGALGVYVGMLVLAFYGWVAYGFFHYRYLRQEEVYQLLKTAGEARMPLAPALAAYMRDRPDEPWRRFWVALLQFFLLPGYYWVWHRHHSFDKKVARVAKSLAAGYPLHRALQQAPGVVSRETLLAAAVGESSGQLTSSLALAPRWRAGIFLLEAAPRLLYPLLLLLSVSLIFGFLVMHIVPKYQAIFADFKVKLPPITESLVAVGRTLYRGNWLIVGYLGFILLGAAVFASSTVRWYLPILGRFYRGHIRGRIMTMLAMLLKEGKPVPEALGILADSGYFGSVERQRMAKARIDIEQGTPLPDSLYRQGLLPEAMMPLVRAAERAHNLPWALGELGEALSSRTMRSAQRTIMGFFPFAICVSGAVVAFVVFGMFLPLLEMMAELNP